MGLAKAYEVFLADARVLPMLPPLLGKTFFTKRRSPVAVDLKKKDLRAELTRAVCGALYRHSAGTSNSVQLGTTAQPQAHLVGTLSPASSRSSRTSLASGTTSSRCSCARPTRSRCPFTMRCRRHK